MSNCEATREKCGLVSMPGGHAAVAETPAFAPAFDFLLCLLESGRTWVKLSAPYESSRSDPPAYEDVTALAQALVRAAPERILWASNWPHPGHDDPQVRDEALLLDLPIEWAPEEAIRNRILVDNPAALYGFG